MSDMVRGACLQVPPAADGAASAAALAALRQERLLREQQEASRSAAVLEAVTGIRWVCQGGVVVGGRCCVGLTAAAAWWILQRGALPGDLRALLARVQLMAPIRCTMLDCHWVVVPCCCRPKGAPRYNNAFGYAAAVKRR
jgi:hypothetical protein